MGHSEKGGHMEDETIEASKRAPVSGNRVPLVVNVATFRGPHIENAD